MSIGSQADQLLANHSFRVEDYLIVSALGQAFPLILLPYQELCGNDLPRLDLTTVPWIRAQIL